MRDDYPAAKDVRAIVDAWPTLIRILNRKVLTNADRVELQNAQAVKLREGLSFETQLAQALAPRFQDREDKKKRQDGTS